MGNLQKPGPGAFGDQVCYEWFPRSLWASLTAGPACGSCKGVCDPALGVSHSFLWEDLFIFNVSFFFLSIHIYHDTLNLMRRGGECRKIGLWSKVLYERIHLFSWLLFFDTSIPYLAPSCFIPEVFLLFHRVEEVNFHWENHTLKDRDTALDHIWMEVQ